MRSGIQLPPRIAALPREDRGYPVPFFAAVIDGKPDLRVADAAKQVRCAKEKVCWVCGQTLGKFSAFIGGPLAAHAGAFSDGPMHRDCAEFSLQYCPHLAIPSAGRSQNVPADTREAPGHVATKPEMFALYLTTNWQAVLIPGPNGGIQFTARDFAQVIWWRAGVPLHPQPAPPSR